MLSIQNFDLSNISAKKAEDFYLICGFLAMNPHLASLGDLGPSILKICQNNQYHFPPQNEIVTRKFKELKDACAGTEASAKARNAAFELLLLFKSSAQTKLSDKDNSAVRTTCHLMEAELASATFSSRMIRMEEKGWTAEGKKKLLEELEKMILEKQYFTSVMAFMAIMLSGSLGELSRTHRLLDLTVAHMKNQRLRFEKRQVFTIAIFNLVCHLYRHVEPSFINQAARFTPPPEQTHPSVAALDVLSHLSQQTVDWSRIAQTVPNPLDSATLTRLHLQRAVSTSTSVQDANAHAAHVIQEGLWSRLQPWFKLCEEAMPFDRQSVALSLKKGVREELAGRKAYLKTKLWILQSLIEIAACYEIKTAQLPQLLKTTEGLMNKYAAKLEEEDIDKLLEELEEPHPKQKEEPKMEAPKKSLPFQHLYKYKRIPLSQWSLPPGFIELFKKFPEDTLFWTGGSIRDLMCGKKPDDWDLVYFCPTEEALQYLPQAEMVKLHYGYASLKMIIGQDKFDFSPLKPVPGKSVWELLKRNSKTSDFTVNRCFGKITETEILIFGFNGALQHFEENLLEFPRPQGKDHFFKDVIQWMRGQRFSKKCELHFSPNVEREAHKVRLVLGWLLRGRSQAKLAHEYDAYVRLLGKDETAEFLRTNDIHTLFVDKGIIPTEPPA